MNNENIKEILDKPKILMLSYGNYISLDDYVKLKNYITNLQEENDFIKKDRNKLLRDYSRLTILLEDYKKKIEKAVEYIKHAQNYGTIAQVMPHLKPYVNGDDLLNLLNGD